MALRVLQVSQEQVAQVVAPEQTALRVLQLQAEAQVARVLQVLRVLQEKAELRERAVAPELMVAPVQAGMQEQVEQMGLQGLQE